MTFLLGFHILITENCSFSKEEVYLYTHSAPLISVSTKTSYPVNVNSRWGNTLKYCLIEAEPENYRMKSRGSLRSTRESSSCVWYRALSPYSAELQLLCSPEAVTCQCRQFLWILIFFFSQIIVNHICSKPSCLACPRWEGHFLIDFMWMLQSLGVLEQLKENATIFLAWWDSFQK